MMRKVVQLGMISGIERGSALQTNKTNHDIFIVNHKPIITTTYSLLYLSGHEIEEILVEEHREAAQQCAFLDSWK